MRPYIAAAALLLLGQAPAPPPSLGANNYRIDAPLRRSPTVRLVWHDEFDGKSLDRRRWASETAFNKQGWFNNERQYYAADRPENLRVAGGRLILTARRERLDPQRYADWGRQDYTSARITSTDGWRQGFFEIRAKLPCARGTWPAIWMLPLAPGAAWPEDGEIDIMEHVGWDPHVVHGTVHTALYVHSRGTQRGAEIAVPAACTAFHRYQLAWDKGAITIGIDDRAYFRVADDKPGGRGAWPFDQPFRLILNLAMGGDWGGAKGIDDAALPQTMEIDYVRVWQEPAH
ncbi:glycoside hydrolase family 16 protein [Sphingomonas sp. KR1UV-12]|uniref:Glycoside hydrolase family 16 protein n=1 Tax=Sphingomonas aurea TaxID=3063994 RepID=A0ABT9EK78_9SPHN|nr:glycoside hydrolase family 16 protein [Sphingomonas sp. KR1UV-12]MDP1027372.1 glycoside hydrolase family 16 protein [Sphingomonas sp. KR1UV-12]